jgi:hypothetical protein
LVEKAVDLVEVKKMMEVVERDVDVIKTNYRKIKSFLFQKEALYFLFYKINYLLLFMLGQAF